MSAILPTPETPNQGPTKRPKAVIHQGRVTVATIVEDDPTGAPNHPNQVPEPTPEVVPDPNVPDPEPTPADPEEPETAAPPIGNPPSPIPTPERNLFERAITNAGNLVIHTDVRDIFNAVGTVITFPWRVTQQVASVTTMAVEGSEARDAIYSRAVAAGMDSERAAWTANGAYSFAEWEARQRAMV